MTSAKFSVFLTPSPLVTVTNQLILFRLSAFWEPPPPPTSDVMYGSPLMVTGIRTGAAQLRCSGTREEEKERSFVDWDSHLGEKANRKIEVSSSLASITVL